MGLLFILIFLLYKIGCDIAEDGILTGEKRWLFQLWKSFLIKWRKYKIFESSKSKLEGNLTFNPKVELIKWSGISFHRWNLSSCNHLIH